MTKAILAVISLFAVLYSSLSFIIYTNLDSFMPSLSDAERVISGIAVGSGLLFAPNVLFLVIMTIFSKE